MKYIEEFRDGDRIQGVYLVRSKIRATKKNGDPYESIVLQDKTGSIDAKIWSPDSPGIKTYDVMDYIHITGEVKNFNGTLQMSLSYVERAEEGDYTPGDYIPVSKRDSAEMYLELRGYIDSVNNKYLNSLLNLLFSEDEKLIKTFKMHSAAKTVHHSFVGGLIQHTLAVARLCDFYSKEYDILNRDLLISAALCHDIGKTKELSSFPINDYTDEGQLLGHIVMGVEMVGEKINLIPEFPVKLANEIKHCILAHHGEYEFGSPKKPAIVEAVALNFADNTDAKIQTMTEILGSNNAEGDEWLGYNRLFESNIRKTGK